MQKGKPKYLIQGAADLLSESAHKGPLARAQVTAVQGWVSDFPRHRLVGFLSYSVAIPQAAWLSKVFISASVSLFWCLEAKGGADEIHEIFLPEGLLD